MAGPLNGVKILEVAGIGPGPMCGMLLADMGADVISIHRPGTEGQTNPFAITDRGKRSIILDFKNPDDVKKFLIMCEKVDAVFEGFRPGVMEKLGIGPDECLARNKKLVYGRMTGWGQGGPMANKACHDLNCISINGVASLITDTNGEPVIPLNLIADQAGGAMFLALGMVCALFEALKSGEGQVVDSAMVDGSALIAAPFFYMHGLKTSFFEIDKLLSGKAPYYHIYQTQDNKHMSVGCIEPLFYFEFLQVLDLNNEELFNNQLEQSKWPSQVKKLSEIFKRKTQAQWCEIFSDTDCCVTPLNTIDDAYSDPHNVERNLFIEVDGIKQPAPAPKFSRSAVKTPNAAHQHGADTEQVLKEFGI